MRLWMINLLFFLLLFYSCKDEEEKYPYEILEERFLDNVNTYRTKQGLPALSMNGKIRMEAREHSKALANGEVNFFIDPHEGFEIRVSNLEANLGEGDFAESIAAGDTSTLGILDIWKGDETDSQNLIGDYELSGVGVAKSSEELYFYVQIFYKTTK